jgi:hypothetical protein
MANSYNAVIKVASCSRIDMSRSRNKSVDSAAILYFLPLCCHATVTFYHRALKRTEEGKLLKSLIKAFQMWIEVH